MHRNTMECSRTWVWIQLGGSSAFFAKKIRCDFMAQTFALIAPVQPVLHRVSCSNEMAPNALKHYEMQQNMSLGSIGVDRVHSLRIIRYDFMAWTFAVIAPVQPILHRVSCSNGMVPNAPKHYKTQQNLSFWSHGVDRLRSLRQILTQLRGINFCINCTSSARFAPSFVQKRNNPKCTQN